MVKWTEDIRFSDQVRYWSNDTYQLVGPLSEREIERHLFIHYTPDGTKSLLDFGCGTGRLYRALHQPCNYVGCDISYDYLMQFRRLHPGVPLALLNKDGETDFLNESFHTIICYSVFTHLRIDQFEKYIMEFHRILTPQGHSIFSFFDYPGDPPENTNWIFLPRKTLFSTLNDVGFRIVRETRVPEIDHYEQTLWTIRKN